MICTRWCSWNQIGTLHTFVGVLPTLQGCPLTDWRCTSEVDGLSQGWSGGRKCSCRTFWLPRLLQELPCQFVNNFSQPLWECAKRMRLAFLCVWYEYCLWCEIILPRFRRVMHRRQAGGAVLECSAWGPCLRRTVPWLLEKHYCSLLTRQRVCCYGVTHAWVEQCGRYCPGTCDSSSAVPRRNGVEFCSQGPVLAELHPPFLGSCAALPCQFWSRRKWLRPGRIDIFHDLPLGHCLQVSAGRDQGSGDAFHRFRQWWSCRLDWPGLPRCLEEWCQLSSATLQAKTCCQN